MVSRVVGPKIALDWNNRGNATMIVWLPDAIEGAQAQLSACISTKQSMALLRLLVANEWCY